VTRLGLGCAPLGNLYSAISDDEAEATVVAAFDAGIRLFDTAPLYGHGLSEQRLGSALVGRPRDSYVLATKVGRLLRARQAGGGPSIFIDAPPVEPVFDFSHDGVLRSIEESLTRLQTDRLDVVHVHDPDDHEQEALAGAFPTLLALRAEGVIGAVGCGMNQIEMLSRFVEQVDLDCILLAGRYTLLDRRGGDHLLPRCADRGIGVVLGGVFNSGLLADPEANRTYDYAPVANHVLARARAMDYACHQHGVELPAAALQFALDHPAVSTVVVGARSATEVRTDVGFTRSPIPDAAWTELLSL